MEPMAIQLKGAWGQLGLHVRCIMWLSNAREQARPDRRSCVLFRIA